MLNYFKIHILALYRLTTNVWACRSFMSQKDFQVHSLHLCPCLRTWAWFYWSEIYTVLRQHSVGYICQLLAQGPWLRMPSRITAPCSFGQNAIHAATSWGRAWFPGTHQDGTLGGLDAVSWCLELDDTLRRSEGCGCSGPSSPSSNPIITGQKSFLGCHSSLFPFCFSLHTSLLICFFGSGESSGGRAEGAKESQSRGFCVPRRQLFSWSSEWGYLVRTSFRREIRSLPGDLHFAQMPRRWTGAGLHFSWWWWPSFDESSGARVKQFRERRRLVSSARPGWVLSTK